MYETKIEIFVYVILNCIAAATRVINSVTATRFTLMFGDVGTTRDDIKINLLEM